MLDNFKGAAPRRAYCDGQIASGAEAAALDDETVAYVLASRPAFDACRDALGQLAGVMILRAAGSRDLRDSGLLDLAAKRLDTARAAVGRARLPAAGRRHHEHVSACVALLGVAHARALATSDPRRDASSILPLLNAASRRLHASSTALPGFPVVAVEACCCGKMHLPPPA